MNPNPYAPSELPQRDSESDPTGGLRVGGMLMTALAAVGLMIGLWVLMVYFVDRHVRGHENAIWSGTLWLSMTIATAVVAASRRSVRPAVACPIAFGLLGITFMVFEGDVSGGTVAGQLWFLTWNLIGLPFGALAIAMVVGRDRKTRR